MTRWRIRLRRRRQRPAVAVRFACDFARWLGYDPGEVLSLAVLWEQTDRDDTRRVAVEIRHLSSRVNAAGVRQVECDIRILSLPAVAS